MKGWINGVPKKVRLKISKTFKKKGLKPPSRRGIPSWNKGTNLSGMSGKHHTAESKRKISEAQKGIPRKYSRGENHPGWKGGSGVRNLREIEYKVWRLNVFQRDSFTCQMPGCGKRGGELNSHHIKRWDSCKELRYDVNNGITLCLRCHNQTKGKEKEFEDLFKEIIKTIILTRS